MEEEQLQSNYKSEIASAKRCLIVKLAKVWNKNPTDVEHDMGKVAAGEYIRTTYGDWLFVVREGRC
jgi:hypothetical protein